MQTLGLQLSRVPLHCRQGDSPSPAALGICYQTLGRIQGSSCAWVRDTEGLELGGAQQFGEFRGLESQRELGLRSQARRR